MILSEQKRYNAPDKDLNGEPGIANALNVEEGVVSIGAVLVQRPVGHISASWAHSDVPGGEDSGHLQPPFFCYLIMGTLMSGWVFKQKERMEMQMKKTEITPITWN